MIYIFGILILILCFGVVFRHYKKVSAIPEDKSIAIFSTVIGIINIIILLTAYFYQVGSENIDSVYLNDAGSIITLVAAITNPLVGFVGIYYGMGMAMTGNPQPIDQIGFLLFFIIPVLISLIINIKLSEIFIRVVRRFTGWKFKFIFTLLIGLIALPFFVYIFILRVL